MGLWPEVSMGQKEHEIRRSRQGEQRTQFWERGRKSERSVVGSEDGESEIVLSRQSCVWVKPWNLVQLGSLVRRMTINHVYRILKTDIRFPPF